VRFVEDAVSKPDEAGIFCIDIPRNITFPAQVKSQHIAILLVRQENYPYICREITICWDL
jgi:hypothetical protein